MTKIIELQRIAELRDGLKKFFPHVEVRPFQAALINQLYDELTTTKNVVVEAPTGLGKTSAVWAAVKAYAEEKRLRVLWLTRTASQVRQVASETGATPVYGGCCAYTRLYPRLIRDGSTKRAGRRGLPGGVHITPEGLGS
jgi:superfamily II DNA or RNA helicase